MTKIPRVVIPAAGLGTRMRPATLAVDKALLTVVDRPIIDYIAMEAALAGVQELVLVCRESRPAVLDYLQARSDAWPGLSRFSVVVQERPLGLGDAVLQSRSAVGADPFGVMLPDVLLYPPQAGMAALVQAFTGNSPDPGQSGTARTAVGLRGRRLRCSPGGSAAGAGAGRKTGT